MRKRIVLIISLILAACTSQVTVTSEVTVTLPTLEILPTVSTSNTEEKECFQNYEIGQKKDFGGSIFFSNQSNIYSFSNMRINKVGEINILTDSSRSPNKNILALLDAENKKIYLLESNKSLIDIDAHPLVADYVQWQGNEKVVYLLKPSKGNSFKYFEFNILSMEGIEKFPWATNMYPKIEFNPLENKYVDLAFSPELNSDLLLMVDLLDFSAGWAIELNDSQNAIYRWSPDGKNILLFDKSDNSEENAIYIVDINGKKEVLLDEMPDAKILLQEPVWSSDSKKFSFWVENIKEKKIYLYIFNLEDKNVQTAQISNKDYWNPIWSPDNLYITFSSKNNLLIFDVGINQRYSAGNCPVNVIGWTSP